VDGHRDSLSRGDGAATLFRRLAAPTINLPKGGGALRGIGEKFVANPVTGTGSMSVPIATSPGRSGFGPQLALSYDSGAGNGPFGFGWTLALPHISRMTDKGVPLYRDATEQDVFILTGTDDLVPVLAADGTRWVAEDLDPDYTVHRYRPRVEGLFARIERWTRKSDGDTYWRSLSRDNVLSLYGKDTGSRIADPTDPTRIFRWLICESQDDKGNAVVYEYKPEDGVGVDLTQSHERNRGDRNDPRRRANRYVKRIRYGNRVPFVDSGGRRPRMLTSAQIADAGWMFEVVFDYAEHEDQVPTPGEARDWSHRVDPFSSYRSGFEVRTGRLCRRVLMFHDFEGAPGVGKDCLVRSTDFTYSPGQQVNDTRSPGYTYLQRVTQHGYRRQDGGYFKRGLPPLELEYAEPVVHSTVRTVGADSLENLPIGVDGAEYAWVDLHGEGIPGILTEQGGGWWYKRNESSIGGRSVELSATTLVAEMPSLAGSATPEARFMDLAGDGRPDLVVLGGSTPGMYEHDDSGESWGPFRAFGSHLNVDFNDPNLRLVDLNGDGRADVLVSRDDVFVWHAAVGEDGFGPAQYFPQAFDEEMGPRLVFADQTESIYLADLSGDGLTDLVRIRNGECCYWPNHGRGFGAKVTMDHAPRFDHPDEFDQIRLRLADIDGTGTADLIYLHRDGVRLYFNQSGNSWSAAHELGIGPIADHVVDVSVTDLLGNGTACLVWSSPLPADRDRAMRYVDLMGGRKPHLLVRAANSLGAETRITYAPSTKFFLDDKRNGRPWITRLPFPVHVIERVEVYDHIARNRFVARYAYHHGYFDGDEREFRGFGLVEQWDTELIAALTESGTFPVGDNMAVDSHVPPVHTKTWFHTGVYLGRDHVSDYFAGLLGPQDHGEYYREPGLTDTQARALLLPDTVLPAGLTLEEEREACRALNGAMLRQEVYADDAGPAATADRIQRADTPYTVTEQNFTVRLAQPRRSNRHAVFFPHSSETISYHYERDPADPRIQHALTLEVDAHGNVLKQAAIGYGRRTTIRVVDAQGQVQQVPNPRLLELVAGDRARQTTALLTYTENRVTNGIDAADSYRTPLPCEVTTFELTGYKPTHAGVRIQASDLVEPDPTAPGRVRHRFTDQVAYESEATTNPCRRPVEHLRSLYRRDDLSGLLPLGELDPLGLPGESYQLAFTPGLLEQTFHRPRTGQPPEALLPDPGPVLEGQGGYVPSNVLKAGGLFPAQDPDDHWWRPSGRSFFTTDPTADAGTELAEARSHFFLERRFRDPFGQDVAVDFDTDNLITVETRDPLGNRMTVDLIDYRVLQPTRVSDPNRNRSEVAFDTLGLVVGTTVMGKPNQVPGEGDSPAGFAVDLTQAQLDAFFDGPDPGASAPELLQGATLRIVYDLDRFRRSVQANPDDSRRWQPPCAATLARETHLSAAAPPQGLRIQLSIFYSDGFGREIQSKTQAESGPLEEGGPHTAQRWVGSGWTIFNNKGKQVRRYEPFFCATHQFQFGVTVGVSPVLFYDPVGRVVATVHPNHTYEKVVFDPWQQTTHDMTDTCAPRTTGTGDPRTDADVQGYVAQYFAHLPPPEWQSWHAQRIGGALGVHEQAAAVRAAAHVDTPTTGHLDALGRPFLSVERNRVACPGHDLDGTESAFSTRIELDIEGNQRVLRDALEEAGDPLGRVVMRYAYDMLGNRIHQASMESGARWMVSDVDGKPIRAWDSRGHDFTTRYDPLRRPREHNVRGTTTDSDPRTLNRDVLVDRIEYGEPAAGASQAELDRALRLNLRAQVYRHFDSAGVVTNARLDANGDPVEAYDFKGNLLCSTRRFVSDHTAIADWQGNPTLSAEAFDSSIRYDALNRPVQSVAPHSTTVGATRTVVQPVFNEANLLQGMDVWLDRPADPAALLDPTTDTPSPVGVDDIDYDAKGQRQRIDYKNGTSTFHHYDPLTFRLTRLYTRRGAAFTGDCDNPQPPPPTIAAPDTPPQGLACGVQNLSYTYDPVGNITHIDDASQQPIYFRNRRVEPSNDYTYDALYRLIQATGREHLGQTAGGANPPTAPDASNAFHARLDHPGDGNSMGAYIERYVYDAVGNFLRMQHRGSDPEHAGWTRGYDYAEASLTEDGAGGTALEHSNRLTRTILSPNGPNPVAEPYEHDPHGNITRMPHLGGGQSEPNLHWNYRDELMRADLGGGGTAHYAYDATGQRVRKVWEKAPGLTEERLYLGGVEIFRRHRGAIGPNSATFERQTQHVVDDTRRIAMVETRTRDTAGTDQAPARVIRYQFGNHLGSSSLELDEAAQIISYEEYAPFGSTTYQAVRNRTETAKRYRYTGKERDEETGFSYQGARYYAPWIGRWLSCDPAGPAVSSNLYRMARCNPVRFVDLTGNDDTETTLVTPMMRKYLANSKIPFAEQVSFELLDQSGKVVTKGQFDMVFRDPHGRLVIPELKGVNVNKLHGNQPVYSDQLDQTGGRIRFTSRKTSVIGLKKGEIVQLTRDQYFRMGKMDLQDFESALQKVTGGKPIVGRYHNVDTGEYRAFTDKAEYQKFLQGKGMKPTNDPKGDRKLKSSMNSLKTEGFKSSMQDMQQYLGNQKSEIEIEADNQVEWGVQIGVGLATGPVGAFKAVLDPERLARASATIMVSPHMFGARGGLGALHQFPKQPPQSGPILPELAREVVGTFGPAIIGAREMLSTLAGAPR